MANMRVRRLSSRYFCPNHPNIRIVPYDSMERVLETLAPVSGRKGPVLLASLNAERAKRGINQKFGWCWQENAFVEGERITQHALVLRYVQRPGVYSRRKGALFTPQAIEAELESRRRA